MSGSAEGGGLFMSCNVRFIVRTMSVRCQYDVRFIVRAMPGVGLSTSTAKEMALQAHPLDYLLAYF